MPGSKESEDILCPYDGCSGHSTRRSNGVFQTYKLSDEEIEEYNERK